MPYSGGMNADASSSAPKEAVVILTTPRLILRTTMGSDIPLLQQRIFRDGDVMRYAFAGVTMPDDRSESFIRSFFTFGETLTGIAVLLEKPDHVIGFAGLFACDALRADDLEIGFVLARHVWGRGIATEIGEAQLDFGFEQLKCERLLGLVDPGNAASIGALEKLGMRYVKDVSDAKRASRSVYIISSDEWRSRRA